MAEKESTAFMLNLGACSLNIFASGTSACVLSVGAAAGLSGIGFYYFSKAAAGVQLLSASGAGTVVVAALALGLGIGIGIFHLTKEKVNKVVKMH